jgi:predicted kinase
MPGVIFMVRRYWPIIWPILAVIAVGIGLIAWGNSRVATERKAWQAISAAQALQAAQETARQQSAVIAANAAATASRASLDALASRTKETAHVYYKDRPIVRCLSVERLRAIKEADTAASVAATAK